MRISTQQWQMLRDCNKRLQAASIADLMATETGRASARRIEAAGLLLDYSRHRLDATGFDQLFGLCDSSQLQQGIKALIAGEPLNVSEQRAALHTALRSDCGNTKASQKAHQEACATHQKLAAMVDCLHQGRWLGDSGKVINNLVNIGIGGSDLGPRLVVDALQPYHHRDVTCHFLSNVDAGALDTLLDRLDPATTLFCITSKSFSTRETLSNARAARDWLATGLGCRKSQLEPHFIAVTARPDRAFHFGISEDQQLPMWDWVGGRFSLWSAVGLPIAAAIGMAGFERLLAGAAAMDEHFINTPPPQNMPIVLALLGLWYRNICQAHRSAVVPYDDRLTRLPDYLQQLDMESNGKSVTVTGEPVSTSTAPVCWGGVGTNAQHAFFQWLHQGPDVVPVDLIGVRQPHHERPAHHRQLVANLIGQANALAQGRDQQQTAEALRAQGMNPAQIESLAPHCSFPGNRPSNLILLDTLSPENLGALLALYEHKIFVQGWLWGINSFDQWGVELGKVLAEEVEARLAGGAVEAISDESTRFLVQWLQR